MLEVVVDHTLCMGAGECVHLLGDGFVLGDDRRSRFVGDADGIGEAELVDVAASCPNFAISVHRDGEPLT